MITPTTRRSRTRYWTNFKLISPTFLAIFFVYSYFQTGTREPKLTTIKTAEQFHAILKNPRVVVVVSASWSDASRFSDKAALNLGDTLKRSYQYQDVVICNVDCSKQQGEVFEALNVWLKEQNKNTAITSDGSGALVWVRKGKIVDIDVQIPQQGLYRLVTRTENAFIRR